MLNINHKVTRRVAQDTREDGELIIIEIKITFILSDSVIGRLNARPERKALFFSGAFSFILLGTKVSKVCCA